MCTWHFYTQWGLPTFQTIAQSENTHTQAVKNLLDRYGLSDPASGTAGVFTNPDLQALYDELVTRGSLSLAEALKVGAAIEEIDILDLQERLSQTDNADIQQVFNNLLQGSGNHLRSFSSTLTTQTGETYQPQYLSADAYQAILGTAPGRGGNSNSRGLGQGGNGGGARRQRRWRQSLQHAALIQSNIKKAHNCALHGARRSSLSRLLSVRLALFMLSWWRFIAPG